MNTDRAKQSLRDLILENVDKLMTGLVHQGQKREIVQVTTSKLTPLHDYYFIGISCPRARTYNKPGVVNVAKPDAWTDYRVLIELYDEASIQHGDTESYSLMTSDFDKFVDRVEAVIRGVPIKVGIGPTKMHLKSAPGNSENSMVVNRADLSGTWQDTEKTDRAWLYAQLEFTLTEQCGSDASLYS